MRTLVLAVVALVLSSCEGADPAKQDNVGAERASANSRGLAAEVGNQASIEPSYDPAIAEAVQSQANIAADRAAEASQADAYAATQDSIDAFSIDVTRAYYNRVRASGLELESALDVERGDASQDAYSVRIVSSADDGKFVIAETCTWGTCHQWATTSIMGYGGHLAGLSAYYDNNEHAPACREGEVTAACGCRFYFMEAYHTVPCARVFGSEAPRLKAELLEWMVARTNSALRQDAPR